MTDADKALEDFFADDGLPARDQAFTHAVMKRAAVRRLRAELASLAGICLLGAMVLWALAPALEPLLHWPAQLIVVAGPAVGVMAAVLTLLWITAPRSAAEVSA
jgi:putative flippase GtrA